MVDFAPPVLPTKFHTGRPVGSPCGGAAPVHPHGRAAERRERLALEEVRRLAQLLVVAHAERQVVTTAPRLLPFPKHTGTGTPNSESR